MGSPAIRSIGGARSTAASLSRRPSDKRLARENARLKGLLADRELELEVLKEINAKKWSA
jgi:hypothetical protein